MERAVDWKTLSELEMRVLSELEEAGGEEVPTLLNTVYVPTGDDHELQQLQDTLKSLLGARLIDIDILSHPIGRVTLPIGSALPLIDGLAQHLFYTGEGYIWTFDRTYDPQRHKIPRAEVVTTDLGEKIAFKILDERGYQWWRR
jgi:hypothetical protein